MVVLFIEIINALLLVLTLSVALVFHSRKDIFGWKYVVIGLFLMLVIDVTLFILYESTFVSSLRTFIRTVIFSLIIYGFLLHEYLRDIPKSVQKDYGFKERETKLLKDK